MRIQQVKCITLLLLLVLCNNALWAQQDPQYTQYMYNPMNINPGYAGSRGVTSIFLVHRAQWVGLDGAPVTSAASVNAPVGRNVGLGVTFVNDKIGPTDTNVISADFSYTLKVNDYYKLGLGIKGSLQLFNVDFTKLNIYDPNDPRFQTNINNQLTPNVGAGAYLYSENTYFGLSVPNILETQHYEANDISVAKERFHVYAMGGHVFDLAYNWKFKPAALAKIVEGAPVQLDLTANVLYNDKFTLGVAYRWDAAVSALAGFQVTNGIFIGYTYDTDTTKLANYNSGSHEIYMRFELFKKYEKVMNPRFF
jgi:type IX secretion system PorP/SprF family membrane protein